LEQQHKEDSLCHGLSWIGDLLPHSHREQSKRVLTYFTGSEHNQADSKGKQIIIQGKSYNLLDLLNDMVTDRKGHLSFDNHLYNFLITLNFPKRLVTNKRILKKLKEHSSLTLKEEEEVLNQLWKVIAHLPLMLVVVVETVI